MFFYLLLARNADVEIGYAATTVAFAGCAVRCLPVGKQADPIVMMMMGIYCSYCHYGA